jgi:hypothetical protein
MLLTNVPGPEPLAVFESLVVGFVDVLQHTPLTVTDAPPSDVTSPPDVAPVEAIAEIAAVVTVGSTGLVVVNWRSDP